MGDSIKTTISKITTGTETDDIRDKILNESYRTKKETTVDYVDILSEYPWTIDNFISQNGKAVDIPHCYAIEYKQKHNSAVTNFINSVTAGVNSVIDAADSDAVKQATTNIQNLWSSLLKSVSSETGGSDDEQQSTDWFTPMKDALGMATEWLSDEVNSITNGIRDSKFMKPYSLLYWLENTRKRYVFPMIAQPPAQNISNTYGENAQDGSQISKNRELNLITSIAEGATVLSKDIRDMSAILFGGQSNGYQSAGVEKAKFFQYPQNTEEYTISFPLINTVPSLSKTPLWMYNYKFIMLFCIRNMIFRKDNASFYPPLFYDLVIPGVIREPFCYVSSVQVVPFGMVRQKSYTLGFDFAGAVGANKDTKFSIAVPEQWHVTIKFKSLLAPSANMVLSSMYDLGIEASSSEDILLPAAQMPGNEWDRNFNIA